MIAQITNSPNVGQAIGVLVHAVAPNINMTDVSEIVGAIFIIARVLRKVIPDNAQTGKLGTVLKHAALEINPQLTPTPPIK